MAWYARRPACGHSCPQQCPNNAASIARLQPRISHTAVNTNVDRNVRAPPVLAVFDRTGQAAKAVGITSVLLTSRRSGALARGERGVAKSSRANEIRLRGAFFMVVLLVENFIGHFVEGAGGTPA